jgi:hypothetical protein
MLPSTSSQIVTEEQLLSKCRYFAELGIWPRLSKIDPLAWLSNFLPSERLHALYLLNGFLYFSKDLLGQLFVASIQGLTRSVVGHKASLAQATLDWNTFLSQLLIVRVTGETPSDADSGYIFVRLARDLLGIQEDRITTHEVALSRLLVNPNTPIVFVDDFVGSGQQFVSMWRRPYELSVGLLSFLEFACGSAMSKLFYCPLFMTEQGGAYISSHCPRVILSPAHTLGSRHSVFHSESIIWPDTLRESAGEFLETASQRAGIPDKNGGVGDWRGFHKLGLTLAFEHGTPDATLPIFYWSQVGWKPLIRSLL